MKGVSLIGERNLDGKRESYKGLLSGDGVNSSIFVMTCKTPNQGLCEADVNKLVLSMSQVRLLSGNFKQANFFSVIKTLDN